MRDPGLEEIVRDDLSPLPELSEKQMFGGLAWLSGGHLLCGARDVGLMVRLGKDNDSWALEVPDIQPMVMQGRKMSGWVRAGLDTCADDALRKRLLDAAIAFVATLPPKI